MLKAAARVVAVAAVLSASLGIIVAQQKTVPLSSAPSKTSPGHAFRAKEILGATVNLKGNTSAGTVEDIVFDDEGAIDYFIVSNNGKLVTVPWEAAKFNFAKHTAVINITPEQYQKIPTYTTQTYPNFYTPTYQTQVYGYYGLTPGQTRRFERRMNRR